MQAIIEARYQRMEKALDTLIDSITAYNPSVTAADELVAADEDVNERLEELALHHANHARILSLRETASNLDNQIKDTVRLLSTARKDLSSIAHSSTPTTTTTTDTISAAKTVGREVRVADLLSYAKFISKTTVPPTFRRPVPKDILSLGNGVDDTNATANTDTNNTKTGALDGAAGADSMQFTNGAATTTTSDSTKDEKAEAETGAGAGPVSRLPPSALAMLDPVSQLPFVPWPSQEIIGAGALARIQGMLEEGRDPSLVLSREEQEREDARRAAEEERQRVEEEERVRRRRESAIAAGGSGAGHRGPVEDVFDPDEI